MATTTNFGDATTPSEGLVTWDSEGTEGGPNHSRILNVPPGASGLTLGRGYDMGSRSGPEIIQDLTDSDVTLDLARTISGAAGLQGQAARDFIVTNKLKQFEISKAGQKALFVRTYALMKMDAQRVCTKPDVTQKYGVCDWAKLNDAIVQILVDLRFRGDNRPDTRAIFQPSVVKNDLEAFAAVLKQSNNWTNVPADRFARRNNFLATALSIERAITALKKTVTDGMKTVTDGMKRVTAGVTTPATSRTQQLPKF